MEENNKPWKEPLPYDSFEISDGICCADPGYALIGIYSDL